MGENICKSMTYKELLSKICKQVIQFNIKKQTTQFKKKIGKTPEQMFFQRRYTGRQQAHKKMLSCQGNATQTHKEIPIGWLLQKPKTQKTSIVEGMQKNWNPYTLQVGS